MTNQEIYQKIEKLYNDEKSKNFVVHLLRNFFPVNKTQAVFFRLEKDGKLLEMKCCITGKSLHAKDHGLELLAKSGNDIVQNRIDTLISSINQIEPPQLLESEKKLGEIMGTIALSSTTSDKLICREAFQELYNFWATEMLKGNKHLNWIAKSERANNILNHSESKKKVTQSDKKTVNRSSNNASMSLGDFDALKELKKKLDSK